MDKAQRHVITLSCIAAIGSLLFGYDTAVISGAVDPLKVYFNLDPLELGWLVGSALIGTMLGVLFSGRATDRFGRRSILLAAALLFLASGIWCYVARSVTELVIARIVGGVGIGLASLLVPIYIAEISPPAKRGALVQLNQIGILVGMLLSYVANAWIASRGDAAWLAATGWRVMLGAEAIPAAVFLPLVFLLPESPRWLLQRGREESARRILATLADPATADAELTEIKTSLAQRSFAMMDLFKKGLRKTVFVTVILAFFQAITGINIVMYYAPMIFTRAGVGTGMALSHSVIIGLVMLVFTMVALLIVDQRGRRPLMMLGSAGMGLSMLVFGALFPHSAGSGWLLLICVLAYVSFFSVGMGGVYFIIVSEIFPTRVRGTAASLSVVSLWVGNYLISVVFPYMLSSLGHISFYIFSALCFLCLLFVFAFLPETKGKSLEQLEDTLLDESREKIRTGPHAPAAGLPSK